MAKKYADRRALKYKRILLNQKKFQRESLTKLKAYEISTILATKRSEAAELNLQVHKLETELSVRKSAMPARNKNVKIEEIVILDDD